MCLFFRLEICVVITSFVFFFKQKTAYEMRISDWSSDVCSSDLLQGAVFMEYLAKSIAEGKVDVARIDAAVKAILEMKYRLGLFDDPYRYSDEAREKATVYRADFLDAARDVARRSMVLDRKGVV